MPETPSAFRLNADNPGASYRQDDAPASADSTPADNQTGGAEPLQAPQRSIEQILAALASTPKDLARLVDGQTEETLARPASDGEWGVVEILPHLRDWEAVYLSWIRRLLDEDMPELEVVDDTLWAIEHAYASENVADALASFGETRAEVVRLLESLDEADWQRQAIHPRVGLLTLHQLADRMCDHDARHREQARDALA